MQIIYASYFVSFGSRIVHPPPWGVNNYQLFQDSEPIILLETPKWLNECILIKSESGNWGSSREKLTWGVMQLLPIGNTKVLNYDHFMIFFFLLAEKLSKK